MPGRGRNTVRKIQGSAARADRSVRDANEAFLNGEDPAARALSIAPTTPSAGSEESAGTAIVMDSLTRSFTMPIGPGGVTISDFLDGHVYGNILSISKPYLARKRARLATLITSLRGACFGILETCCSPSERKLSTYEMLSHHIAIVNTLMSHVAQHPHTWPTGDPFLFILSLRAHLARINTSTAKSLETGKLDAFMESGSGGTAHGGVLLPSSLSEETITYRFAAASWPAAFPFLCTMYTTAKSIAKELGTPAYAWEIALKTNIGTLARNVGAAFDDRGLFQFLYTYLSSEATNYYLGRLNVKPFAFSAARLLAYAVPNATADMGSASLKSILRNREKSTEIFGEATMREYEKIAAETEASNKFIAVGTTPAAVTTTPPATTAAPPPTTTAPPAAAASAPPTSTFGEETRAMATAR